MQEHVDAEIAKAIGEKLERVNKDLLEVRRETAALLKQREVNNI